MEGSDELLTIAELAVGLAGIAGLVVAFTRHGRLLPTDRFRFPRLSSPRLSSIGQRIECNQPRLFSRHRRPHAPRVRGRTNATPELCRPAPLLEGVYIVGPRSCLCEF